MGRVWHALDDDVVVGRAQVMRRPDQRAFVAVDAWHADVGSELLETVVGAVPGALYSTVGEDDAVQAALFGLHGFVEGRREDELLVPVRSYGGADRAVISAADADVDRLQELDERLRGDVPGSDGWHEEPDAFREHTFDERIFDPETYLVAVDGGEYVGLCRIWKGRRLGLVGVLPSHRGQGLGTALLRQAMRPLVGRVDVVTAEADATNHASLALLRGFGATRTGGTVEFSLRRR